MRGLEALPFAANLYRVPVAEGYFLVDAGLPWEAGRLLRLLREPPRLLFLTHHHTDHSGGARALWEQFGLPILAHPKEWPYLTKEKPRPPLPIP
ncbi:MBL fold metallo-hydrolase, partial [Thermus scotoductus]